jgi:hypothetical protein
MTIHRTTVHSRQFDSPYVAAVTGVMIAVAHRNGGGTKRVGRWRPSSSARSPRR